MDDFTKLGNGTKIPPIADQVFGIQKKRKADDQGRQSKKKQPESSENKPENEKHLLDIKDTDRPETENPEGTEEEEIGYEGRAKKKKRVTPKLDVVI